MQPLDGANTEAFAAIDGTSPSRLCQAPRADGSRGATGNRPASPSSLSGRLRRASKSFEQSDMPDGFLAAAGDMASSILSRHGAPQPASSPPRKSATVQPVAEEGPREGADEAGTTTPTRPAPKPLSEPPGAAPFPNGYHFPPKHSLGESMKLASLAFWDYFLTPIGFLVTVYGLNVVAWGGMLFLLLCNASPAMCYPTCNDIDSPRRKWIEIDSQILNALFCVTGFGLAPWRFRDLYYLLQYRLLQRPMALRRLAGIHRGWFRLGGSADLSADLGPQNIESHPAVSRAAVPYPEKKIPVAPLTGMRARPTRVWKLDAVVWLMVCNTLLQCCLSGFMWGMSRYDRPSWATGLFVGLACSVAGVGGLIMFLEGKAVKSVEGVPVSLSDLERLEEDRERGIWHYNNIRDKDLGAEGKKDAQGGRELE